jgi:hypothetical protein
MGAARLMVKSLRPKLIIMEVFVHRLRACNVRDFLGAFGQLNYTMDVSPRLNMPYCTDVRRCTQLSSRNGYGPHVGQSNPGAPRAHGQFSWFSSHGQLSWFRDARQFSSPQIFDAHALRRKLTPFLNSLGPAAEMDLVFYQGHHPP